MIGLAAPWALLLLILPLVTRRLLPAGGAGGAALVVPQSTSRALIAGHGGAVAGRRAARLAPLFAYAMLVLAISGPQQLVPTPALPVSGRDLVMALDLSGSMVREDFALDGETVTRLDAVKAVGAPFVRGRQGDRVGLVVFGSDAYVAAPLSFDTEAVAQALETAEIGISGRATNIGDAIGLALKRLDELSVASRVVVLLSDGESNAGAARPDDVAALARDMGVRIHTIAMGPKDLGTAEEGELGVVDAATLTRIAAASGGESFRVRTTEDLALVAAAIDALEKTQTDGLAAEIHRPLWIWPALASALLYLWIGWRDGA